MAAHNPPANRGHQASTATAHDDEHQSPIKTPKQLITVVVLAFVIPILVIILLAEVAGGRAEAADDLDALRWVDPAAHATMPYAFEADKRVIDWYFAGDLPVLPIDRRHAAR